MKTNRMMLMAAILALTTVAARAEEPTLFSKAASYNAADCARIDANYVEPLGSSNPGVVESALGHMTLAKIISPAWKLKRVEKKLEELAFNGGTPTIRYKAYLATMVFANPALFADEKSRTYENGDELFKVVAERLKGSLLTANEE